LLCPGIRTKHLNADHLGQVLNELFTYSTLLFFLKAAMLVVEPVCGEDSSGASQFQFICLKRGVRIVMYGRGGRRGDELQAIAI